MPSVLQTQTSGAVRRLRLNRPEKRNALNGDLVSALTHELRALREADDIRAVVLTGAGSAFSAGADLSSLRAMQEASPLENERDSRALATLFQTIYRHPKPVIARVNGPAIGGGCGLAAVCDFSVVSEEVKLGFSEVRLGFVPAIVMVFVRRKLGEAAARDVLLRGRLLSAEEATEIGLVSRITADPAGLAREIADNDPAALRAIQRLLRTDCPQPEQERQEAAAFAELIADFDPPGKS